MKPKTWWKVAIGILVILIVFHLGVLAYNVLAIALNPSNLIPYAGTIITVVVVPIVAIAALIGFILKKKFGFYLGLIHAIYLVASMLWEYFEIISNIDAYIPRTMPSGAIEYFVFILAMLLLAVLGVYILELVAVVESRKIFGIKSPHSVK